MISTQIKASKRQLLNTLVIPALSAIGLVIAIKAACDDTAPQNTHDAPRHAGPDSRKLGMKARVSQVIDVDTTENQINAQKENQPGTPALPNINQLIGQVIFTITKEDGANLDMHLRYAAASTHEKATKSISPTSMTNKYEAQQYHKSIVMADANEVTLNTYIQSTVGKTELPTMVAIKEKMDPQQLEQLMNKIKKSPETLLPSDISVLAVKLQASATFKEITSEKLRKSVRENMFDLNYYYMNMTEELKIVSQRYMSTLAGLKDCEFSPAATLTTLQMCLCLYYADMIEYIFDMIDQDTGQFLKETKGSLDFQSLVTDASFITMHTPVASYQDLFKAAYPETHMRSTEFALLELVLLDQLQTALEPVKYMDFAATRYFCENCESRLTEIRKTLHDRGINIALLSHKLNRYREDLLLRDAATDLNDLIGEPVQHILSVLF